MRSASPLVLAALVLGCRQPAATTYEPRMDLDDLVPGLDSPSNGYLLLTDEKTQGRFACGLAIAKFAPVNGEGPLQLTPVKANEQAYWTEQLTGVSAVRDLAFLTPISTRPDGQAPAALCALAGRLNASLLLIYAPNRFAPNAAQVFGVLYDVERRSPIATLHTSIEFDEESGIAEPPDDEQGDHRDIDAAYQAPRAFEEQTLACLRELTTRDAFLPTTQPHKWQTRDRWWIPTKIKTTK